MPSIKKDLTHGVFWIAIAQYSGFAVQLLVTAVLARLISPAAFGTIAVAMVILNFLNIISDIGIGPAIVQFKGLTQKHLNNLFTLNLYIGIILGAVLFLSSEFVSNYYADDVLIVVCKLMAIVVFFNSLNVVPNALMRKDKRFRTIALRTMFFQVSSGILAILSAFKGWGVYALLVSPIITSIGVFFVNYYNYPQKVVLKVQSSLFNMIGSFSFFQFAFSFFNYFSRNLDKLIIGKFFSLSQLGYYDKSYHLMMLPLQNVTFVIGPVLHPVISTLQNDRWELSNKCRKLAVVISTLSFPLGLILFFCGGEMIRIVYGSQWDSAIPVFRILALSIPLQMIMSCSGPFYQTTNKTNIMFAAGLFNTLCTVTSFIIGAYWGRTIESMAVAWDISLLINFIVSYYIMHHFAFKLSVIPFCKSLLPQLINSIIVFVLLSFSQVFWNETNPIISLVLKSVSVLSLSIIMGLVLRQYSIYSLFRIVSNKIKK